MTGPRAAAPGLREAVAGIWCAALGVDRVEAQDDFFLEGGDSALAVETAFSLRALADPELGLDIVYRYPKFGQLLEALSEPRPQAERRPLTPAEERLWVAERLHPGSPQYHIVALYRFAGALDVPRLRTALGDLVARHPALRRGFEPPGRAVTAHRAQVSCRWMDGRDVPDEALRELIDEHARRPFDLAAPPLLRALVVDRGDAGDLLLLTLHHLICDGGSIAILEDDLSRLYTHGASGAGSDPAGAIPAARPDSRPSARSAPSSPPSSPPSSSTRPDASPALPDEEESRAHWRRVLAGCPRSLPLPHDLPPGHALDHPRPAALDNAGGVYASVCPGDLLTDMARLAAEEGLSPFMTWVIAYTVGLATLTGQRDLVIGIAASSRTRAQRGEIGMFADPLPLRLRLPEKSTVRELARRVRRATTEALAYRGLSLHTIIEDLGPGGDPGRMPLVQAGLSYLDVSNCALRFDALEARRELLPTGTAKYELIWVVTRQAEQTVVELEYLSGLFSAEKAVEVHGSIMRAARAAFARPDAELQVPEVVRQAVRPPAGTVPPAEASSRRPLPDLVRQWAEQRPDAAAVRHQETELTYRQLYDRAVSVAAGLRSAGLRRGSVVAVPMKRGVDSVSAYLGIHYAGCAYLPLDPDLPGDRLRSAVLDVAEAAIVVGETSTPWPPQLTVLTMERLLAEDDPAAARQVPVPITGEDAAYLMSTSGSTGRPKTVVVPHRAISRLVPDTEGLAIDAADRVAHVCNPAFDAATLEIWGALGAGALLVIGDKQDVLSPARLSDFLNKHRISVLGLPTALLNTMIDVTPDAFGELRLLVFGGEKADEQRLARLLAHRPPAHIVNVYGPTENTTVSTLQEVTAEALVPGPLSIGRCIDGSTAHVLAPDGTPVPPGAEGELYVGGDGLARGYHDNPSLTAASFGPDPFDQSGGKRLYRTGDRVRLLPDGAFHFVGRNDDQVKVRGYRVELGEIEHALRSMPAVADAAVLARPTPDGVELVACVVPDSGGVADLGGRAEVADLIGLGDLAGLADELREKLPDYMIPAFVAKDRFPLNANGKVDRAALLASLPRDIQRPRSLDAGAASGATAVSAASSLLADTAVALWCESLGTEYALPDDNFIALGGHSIKALKLLARVEDKLGVAVDLADFLAEPTLRALVEAIQEAADPSAPNP